MTTEQLRKILEELKLDFESKPTLVYIFYETPDGLVNNLSVSIHARKRNGRQYSPEELMRITEAYPSAAGGRILAVVHPEEGLTRWMDTLEVCEALHTTRGTLRRWTNKGLLHPSRTGRRIYFDAKEVDALLRSNVIQDNGRLDQTGMD